MPLESVLIGPYDSGLETKKKPFLLLDTGFQQLDNAYCWRERIKKREGIKLAGRLRRVIAPVPIATTTTGGSDTVTISNILTELMITGEPNASIEPGTLTVSVAAPDAATFTDAVGTENGTLDVTGAGLKAGSYINYTTKELVLKFTGAAAGGATITVGLSYYPNLPCMGITQRELSSVNNEQTIFYDTKYAYVYNGTDFIEFIAGTTWSGNNSDFFSYANYRGSTASDRLYFTTNFSASDPIRYTDGTTWTNFSPVISNNGIAATETRLYKARIIVPYYGRLVALNTYEGRTSLGIGSSENFFSRCRFSQVGSPIEAEAWYSDEFGRGGFIDAPTSEAIIGAQFFKNTLIVFFERSTWTLSYVGEYGLPFTWERISSDLGSESTFSVELFDDGIVGIGDKAIITSSATNVQRIDLDIPDQVFNFQNVDNGKKRIHSARDFQKEIVYWSYVDGDTNPVDPARNKFPNRVLLYNYRNGTWAKFRDNVTAFGPFKLPTGVSWNDTISWNTNVSWNDSFVQEFPAIASGNQQGFIHFYQYPAAIETVSTSEVFANEQESLYIEDITLSASANIKLKVINHNLELEDVIYITKLNFVDTTNATVLTTNLNNRFYQVSSIEDDDNFYVEYYNFKTKTYQNTDSGNFSFTPAVGAGTYLGAGLITLFPRMQIRTKDFNPYIKEGKQLMLSYVDLQADATPNSQVSIDVNVNSAQNPDLRGNLLVGNQQDELSLYTQGIITGATKTNPCQITSVGHSLNTGDQVTIKNVKGMTQLNGNTYTITFVDLDNFSLDGVDATAYSDFEDGGNWYSLTKQFYYVPGQEYAWSRFYANVYGQYLSFLIHYDDELMNIFDIHQQKFEMNAMQIWLRSAGRIV